MAGELSSENVPQFYKEVGDILCPHGSQIVDQDMFLKLLMKSSLPKNTLSQIWGLVESKEGYLTLSGLYRALALTALAQQGNSISADTRNQLLRMPPEELPKPSLGDLSDLRIFGIQLRQERTPSRLGLTYTEICMLDTVEVVLVPERKGIFLKHVEYEVTTQRYKTTVERRYNDFLALHELLMQRFPYRLIPPLPPKKGVSVVRENAQFLEARRKALKRFLTLLVRHPIISEDKILQFFLTFVGPDLQHKIKEHFRGIQDEFYTNSCAQTAKDLVPLDSAVQLPQVKEHLRHLAGLVEQIRDCMAHVAESLNAGSFNWQHLCKHLGNIPGRESEWGAANPNPSHSWRGDGGLFPSIQNILSSIANAQGKQAEKHEESLVEELNLYLDLLIAFKELADRHDNRYNPEPSAMMKKRGVGMNSPVQDLPNPLQQLENRSYFFVHCLHLEVQLVNTYSEILGRVLSNLVTLQHAAAKEAMELWSQIKLS